jgi:hypothetical protein
MVTKTAVRYHVPALLLTCSLTLAAGPSAAGIGEERPDFLRGAILHRHTDGIADDLLTAGLGRTGLANPTPPGFADSLSPTAAELRRRAIYTNYRALVDMSPGGGYGTLYGPNVTADGTVTGGEGLIAGDEYLALAREDDQEDGTVLMVQVPDSFDPANACIVTAPSSGSRGIYGAIATAGEWGLKNGCAVAYTDKGTGIGAHDLQGDRVDLITGAFVDADDAGRLAQFDADLSAARLAAFNATMPNRYAFRASGTRRTAPPPTRGERARRGEPMDLPTPRPTLRADRACVPPASPARRAGFEVDGDEVQPTGNAMAQLSQALAIPGLRDPSMAAASCNAKSVAQHEESDGRLGAETARLARVLPWPRFLATLCLSPEVPQRLVARNRWHARIQGR